MFRKVNNLVWTLGVQGFNNMDLKLFGLLGFRFNYVQAKVSEDLFFIRKLLYDFGSCTRNQP